MATNTPAWAAKPSYSVFALVAFTLLFVPFFAPGAVAFGHVARREVRRTGQAGDGLACIALLLGYLLLVVEVLLLASLAS